MRTKESETDKVVSILVIAFCNLEKITWMGEIANFYHFCCIGLMTLKAWNRLDGKISKILEPMWKVVGLVVVDMMVVDPQIEKLPRLCNMLLNLQQASRATCKHCSKKIMKGEVDFQF